MMKHLVCSLLAAALLPAAVMAQNNAPTSYTTAAAPSAGTALVHEVTDEAAPVVYYIREITPETLVKIYEALGRPAQGRVGVKVSTGESGGTNFLNPQMVKPLVDAVGGTIIECNTAYGGSRADTRSHLQTVTEHGWDAIAKVDIMDGEGEVRIPVTPAGKHLSYDIVGKNFLNYDYVLVLSHFKGHAMGGFGGAMKNISIGIGSSNGKAWIHSAGTNADPATLWQHLPAQDDFLESMAEAGKAVADHMGKNIVYINVANNLSVDCDCASKPEDPRMGNIGILASLDPVAVDQACVDMVYASPDHGKIHLVERMESRHAIHTLEHAQAIGVGQRTYRLVEIK